MAATGRTPGTAMIASSCLKTPGGLRTCRDTRPVGDKAYQGRCVRNICAYFSEVAGYPGGPVVPKSLTSPSTKEYFQMVTFLLERIDPNILQGGKRVIEKDLFDITRRLLRYPNGSIPKSARCSVGAPTSWPLLLALLDWLVEANRSPSFQMNLCLFE
jgi:kinetochore protein NDC80